MVIINYPWFRNTFIYFYFFTYLLLILHVCCKSQWFIVCVLRW